MKTETKPCPACGGVGEVYDEDFVHGVTCQTCHGRGTIRPTQDPRFLFWCMIHSMAMPEIEQNWYVNTPRRSRWMDVAGYALKKQNSIIANKPRRTTAK